MSVVSNLISVSIAMHAQYVCTVCVKWKLLGQFPNDQQMGLNVSSILFFFFTRNRKYSTKSVTVGLHFSLFKACQPLANSSIFSGEAGCFRTESAFYHWSAVFSLHFTPGVQSTVCVLRWPVSNILNAGQSENFSSISTEGFSQTRWE